MREAEGEAAAPVWSARQAVSPADKRIDHGEGELLEVWEGDGVEKRMGLGSDARHFVEVEDGSKPGDGVLIVRESQT